MDGRHEDEQLRSLPDFLAEMMLDNIKRINTEVVVSQTNKNSGEKRNIDFFYLCRHAGDADYKNNWEPNYSYSGRAFFNPEIGDKVVTFPYFTDITLTATSRALDAQGEKAFYSNVPNADNLVKTLLQDYKNGMGIEEMVCRLVEPMNNNPEFNKFITEYSNDQKEQDNLRNYLLGCVGYKVLGFVGEMLKKELNANVVGDPTSPENRKASAKNHDDVAQFGRKFQAVCNGYNHVEALQHMQQKAEAIAQARRDAAEFERLVQEGIERRQHRGDTIPVQPKQSQSASTAKSESAPVQSQQEKAVEPRKIESEGGSHKKVLGGLKVKASDAKALRKAEKELEKMRIETEKRVGERLKQEAQFKQTNPFFDDPKPKLSGDTSKLEKKSPPSPRGKN